IPFDAIVCIDFRCAQEITNLILARSGLVKKAEILLACVRPFNYNKLPIPAIYCDSSMNETAYRGVKCLVEMISTGESYPHKIELTSTITVEK
ncbi:MAG: hypothetical protein WC476_12900, partial [Phycisphaerae bacterium]